MNLACHLVVWLLSTVIPLKSFYAVVEQKKRLIPEDEITRLLSFLKQNHGKADAASQIQQILELIGDLARDGRASSFSSHASWSFRPSTSFPFLTPHHLYTRVATLLCLAFILSLLTPPMCSYIAWSAGQAPLRSLSTAGAKCQGENTPRHSQVCSSCYRKPLLWPP